MKMCDFSITVERSGGRQRRQCTRCKYTTVSIPDRDQPIYRECERQGGLGDLAGWLLSLVGITQSRMQQIGWDCSGGCDQRKAVLNQVGWEVNDRVKWLTRWFRVPPPSPSKPTDAS